MIGILDYQYQPVLMINAIKMMLGTKVLISSFQEDRMAFDICNGRVSSAAVAKSQCHAKQLSILDKALEKNYNSMALLGRKVALSEQSMPSDQYLAMLKSLVLMPGILYSLSMIP